MQFASFIKYIIAALYIDILLIYICYYVLKIWFSSYDNFNRMIKFGYTSDISNCSNTELFNLGYWTKYSNTEVDPYAFNNASNNLEKYMLGKLNISNVRSSRLLIINPSLEMISNTTLNKSYFLFTSIDRYEQYSTIIDQNNLSISILNPDGIIPYADGCIDKIINIESNVVCDREKLIKECYRILKPKTGIFIFSTLDCSNKSKAYLISLFYDIPIKNLIGLELTMNDICNELKSVSFTTADITEYSLLSLLDYLYSYNNFIKSINPTKYVQYILNMKYHIVICNKID